MSPGWSGGQNRDNGVAQSLHPVPQGSINCSPNYGKSNPIYKDVLSALRRFPSITAGLWLEDSGPWLHQAGGSPSPARTGRCQATRHLWQRKAGHLVLPGGGALGARSGPGRSLPRGCWEGSQGPLGALCLSLKHSMDLRPFLAPLAARWAHLPQAVPGPIPDPGWYPVLGLGLGIPQTIASLNKGTKLSPGLGHRHGVSGGSVSDSRSSSAPPLPGSPQGLLRPSLSLSLSLSPSILHPFLSSRMGRELSWLHWGPNQGTCESADGTITCYVGTWAENQDPPRTFGGLAYTIMRRWLFGCFCLWFPFLSSQLPTCNVAVLVAL